MGKTKKYKLIDLVENDRGISYGVVQPGTFQKEGIPFIRVNNLTEGKLEINDVEKILPQIESKYKRTKLKGNELLVSLVGSLGHIGYVKQHMIGWNVARAVGVLPIKKEFDKDWIYWVLKSPKVQEEFRTNATTSVQATLNLKQLQDIEIAYPEKEFRKGVIGILSSLDNKIELNRRMSQILEQMAQTLFEHYFVDNIDPDNLPKDWRWGKMKELCYQSKASVNPTKLATIFHHYSIPAFDEGQKPSLDEGTSILSNKFLVRSNSVLFSKLNPRFPRVWLISEIDEKVSICSTEFLVFVPVERYYWCFTYLYLSHKEVIDNLTSKAGGTSGSHQRVKPEDILELEVIIPSCHSLERFEGQIRPMLLKKIENLREVDTLTKIRDTLFPKLMSGEIDVDELINEELIAEDCETTEIV